MKNNKGFTLIELLVVVAIIGLLASIVLASLVSARAKGIDAAAKEELHNAMSQAEIYRSNHGNSYTDVCHTSLISTTHALTTDNIHAILAKAASIEHGGIYGSSDVGECEDGNSYSSSFNSTSWAASIPLKSGVGQYFCVDSTGVSRQTAFPPISNQMTSCSPTTLGST